MKHTFIILLLAFCTTAFCQQQPNLGLIPTPQKVETLNGTCNTTKAKVKEQKVSQLPVEANQDQAYRLVIEPKAITIQYIEPAGLQNALLTLNQLKQLYGENLPCVTITDWPAYRWRGWMDDISRGPVPHAEYRQLQWAMLHALKYNFCNYYTEHTLYQQEFPDLAPEYAAKCKPHPDEFINLQLFAHAEKTLRIPFYQNMMDSKANYNPAEGATYDFLRQRIAAAIDRIPSSPFFIINCDETEQLGSGRAKKLVDEKGADQVYIDHLNRCCEIIKEEVHNSQLRPVMWGDIVAKNPAMMKQLPDDMVYIMWAYEPLDSYDQLIKPFREQGNPFWVAPSLSHSSNMVPNPYRYMKNIANLARDGHLNGAEGLMNTCWDDNGEALFDNCWHGLFWSAEMAWNPIKTNDPEEFRRREEQFNRNYERLFYGSDLSDLSDLSDGSDLADKKFHQFPKTQTLYTIGALESNPAIGDWYNSAALMEPLLNFNPDNTYDDENKDYRPATALGLVVNTHVDSAANPHAHYALKRMELTCLKAHLRKSIHDKLEDNDMIDVELYAKEYLQELFNLKREYLRLWDQENGEYERYIVTNRYDDLAREVLNLDRHVFIETSSKSEVQGSKFEVQGSKFKVQGSKFKVQSSKFKVQGSRFPTVSMRTLYGGKDIHYTLDGSEPTSASTLYTEPFSLDRSATIRAIAYNEYGEGVETSQYLLSHLAMGAKMTLATKYGSDYRSVYSGGGDNALIDGQLGSNTSYTDGHWQGYWGDSIDARIDFGSPRELHSVSMRFIQNTYDWVLAPKQVKIYTSNDGKEWQLLTEKTFETDPRQTGFLLKHYSIDIPQPTQTTTTKTKNSKFKTQNYQYLRVVVPSGGPLPEWHTAPGQPSWLFCDEIVVE